MSLLRGAPGCHPWHLPAPRAPISPPSHVVPGGGRAWMFVESRLRIWHPRAALIGYQRLFPPTHAAHPLWLPWSWVLSGTPQPHKLGLPGFPEGLPRVTMPGDT